MPRRHFAPRRGPFGSFLLGGRDQSPRRLRYRVQILLTVLLGGTNLVGVLVALVVAVWASPGAPINHASKVATAIVGPAYLVGALVVGFVFGTSSSLRVLRWATDPENEPDEEQRRRSLRVPLRLTLLQFGLWLGAALLVVVVASRTQPSRVISATLVVLITGVVVSGMSYLLAEFALRPVAARALEGVRLENRVRGAGVGSRMLIFWGVGTGAPVLGLLITGVLALIGYQGTLHQLAVVTITVCTAVLLVGFGLTDLMARSVRAPLVAMRDAIHEVGEGNLDVDVAVYDGTELGLLQSGFNDMVKGLRDREKIRDLFERHVGHEVARQASALETGEINLTGETRRVTVLFVDLIGSTAYAAERHPVEVVATLNRYFGVIVDEVDSRHGLINKFIGDAVLAVFGAPVVLADHAAAGLSAARTIAARLATELPEVRAGIGIATGTVVAGNVGHLQRFEYTVIGDAVNSASRITDLAKERPTGVLAMWDTVVAARATGYSEAGSWRRVSDRVLRGRTEATALAEPIDLPFPSAAESPGDEADTRS